MATKIVAEVHETELRDLLEKLKAHEFKKGTKTDADETHWHYDIKYSDLKLHLLEALDEGEITLAGRIHILRKYVAPKTVADSTLYNHYSRIQDVTIAEKRANVCIVHGFAQCSDTFFETALQLALNGYVVHLMDLDGAGYSAGPRISGHTIANYMHNVATLLLQVDQALPVYLMGHSMGGMIVNQFLQWNPEIAEKLAGVIYSAPFFGMAQKLDSTAKKILPLLAEKFDSLCLLSEMQLHRICKNKAYLRQVINQRKAIGLISPKLASSFLESCQQINKNAGKVTYPYQLVFGEKDVIVDNQAIRDWHTKTASKVKEQKQMVGAYHELSKEPNNKIFFTVLLQFMKTRGMDKERTKPFGQLDPKSVKFPVKKDTSKGRKNRWLLLYFLIGLILTLLKRSKRYFVIWPLALIFHKRLGK